MKKRFQTNRFNSMRLLGATLAVFSPICSSKQDRHAQTNEQDRHAQTNEYAHRNKEAAEAKRERRRARNRHGAARASLRKHVTE